MKWIHIKACFESDDVWLAEELVSDIFFTLGLKGVVCQIPLPEPEEGFGSDALPISKENSISGYIPATESSEKTLEIIKEKSKALKESGIEIAIKTEIVDQEDWAESWKEFFFATRITERIVVKPAWREFDAGPNDIIVEIDPGMAFGTGTHETTSMCISLIEKYLRPDSSFLDVGTGSGILMITAAKLGAARMAGIDNDEVAVIVAKENLEKNMIDSDTYHIRHQTIDKYEIKQFDIVAANILAEVIIEIIPDLKKRIKPDGTAILSGIINDKKDLVVSELIKNNFSIINTQSMGEWVAIAAKP
ncbi:MAG: 50S ribosomal protein L11 methyltransferase, partial [Thermodesulfobacteriota bacterium]|nr:50S ribosomal protein L11 methyltransferase [Thermodesulfobacteriota bacterium]